MPHLDEEALAHLADLARLDLDPGGRGELRADLEKVLGYVDRLAAYDDPSVAPLRHPAHDDAPRGVAALRRDEPRPAAPTGDAIGDDVERQGGRVVVPRTLDGDG